MPTSLAQLGWNRSREAALVILGEPGLAPGRVIAEHRGVYRVSCQSGEIPAEVTGRFMFLAEERLDYPVVGDWVAVALLDKGRQAVIHHILPRQTVLARKYAGKKLQGQAIAANIDRIFIVVGLDHDFNLNRVERYLAVASGSGAQPVVLLSKCDLVADAGGTAEEVRRRTAAAEVIAVSSRTGEGAERIREHLAGNRTGCFIGSSGAGKTSLINLLAGTELLPTAEVREADSKGRHTTTHRELFVLPGGGIVIDTPGMREIGLWDAEEGIASVFNDIEELGRGCAFRDCTHRVEPECAVRAAVAAGTLEPGRYESFLKLGREQERLDAQTDRRKQLAKKARDKQLAKTIREVSKRKPHRS